MRTRGDRVFEIICIIVFVAPIGGSVLGYLLSLPFAFVVSLLPVKSGPGLAAVELVFQGVVSVAGGVWLAWYVWPKPGKPKQGVESQSNEPPCPADSAGG